MRWLVVLLLIAPASALTVDDPQGDATVQAFVTSTPTGSEFQSDLLQLDVVESQRHVEFRITATPIPEEPDFESYLTFMVDGKRYDLRVTDKDSLFAVLDGHDRRPAKYLPVAIDGDTRSITIAKELLRGADGALPRIGSTLTITEGHALGPHVVGGDLYAVDTWDELGTLTFTLGNAAADQVLLTSDAPDRVSNGAATVYVYNVTVRSLVDQDLDVQLSAQDVPGQWEAMIPTPDITLAAGEERHIPILVNVPFAHQHGTYDAVRIEASVDGAPLTSMALGVEYTATPQPAGHHRDMWFHVAADGRRSPNLESRLFFSTLEDHEDTVDELVPGWCTRTLEGTMYHWFATFATPVSIGLALSPEPAILEIPFDAGLDIGTVHFEVSIGLQGATLYEGRQNVAIQQGVQSVRFEIPPLAETVEPEPGREMALRVEAHGPDHLAEACEITGIRWAPGATMHLPLNVYRDSEALPDDGLNAHALAAAPGPGSRLVIPHHFQGEPGDEVRFAVVGPGAEWSRLEPSAMTLDAAGEATTHLVIEIPADASPGHQIDLVVGASSATMIGIERTTFTVADAPPVQEVLPSGVESPGAPLLAIVAALALFLRRR